MSDSQKLHIDSDWKAQAEAERQRLAHAEAEKAAAGGDPNHQPLPPADMRSLVGTLASQALAGLGMYGDRESGRLIVDFEGAKFAIDLLGVLEEKTKGNLTPEEATEIKQVLAELRSRFVQLIEMVRKQSASPMGAGAPAVATQAAPAATPSKLIIPG